MSVPEQVPYKEYRATGSNNSFEITFYLPDPKDLVVMVNKEIPPVGAYSIQGNTVVFNTPPNEGDLVELTRDTQLDRETNFKSYDNSFRPETINFDLDKIWLVLQESNLVDAKILARLKQEIEWRRTHDFNYDELAQVREKQIFDALKGYADTLYSATDPNVFAGVIAGVVFARDGKSIQTHLEEIADQFAEERQYLDEQLGLKVGASDVYPKDQTYTQEEVNNLISPKADLDYVNDTFSSFAGGRKAYTTLALAVAAQSTLPADTVIDVTNDPTASNNGTYQWNGTTLTKSAYDPLVQAKSYSDTKIENTQHESFLELHKDFMGKTYKYVDKAGRIFVPFLSDSIQDEILQLKTKVSAKNNAQLLEAVDKNGKTFAVMTSYGALYANDFVTPAGGVNRRLDALESSKNIDDNANTLKYFDRTIASQDAEQVLINSSLMSNADIGMNEIFAPQIIRTDVNKFLIFAEGRTAGDYGRIKIVSREITVNADLSVTKGVIKTVRDYGTDENNKDYDCYNPAPVVLDSGRILLFYVKRSILSHEGILTTYNYFTPYMIYSDDNGATWSVEQEMRPFLSETPTVLLPTPANGIVLKRGVNKGRLVMPFYKSVVYTTETRQFKAFVMYSDDGGVTWQKGGESTHPYDTNESAIAENDDGTLLFLTRDISNFKSTEISRDGGLTFQDLNMRRTDIQTTVCQSGMIQVENKYDLSVPKLFITCPTRPDHTRFDLGIYGSYDGGETWPVYKQLTNDSASYSALQVINERTLLAVYSANINRDIRAVIVNLKSIFLGA